MARPTWDDTFFDMCHTLARRSTCVRLHTACVIIDHWSHAVLATGYNGSIRGQPHCDDVGCLMVDGHCKRTIHAERNAFLSCARLGSTPLHDGFMYVLHEPCMDCAKDIAQVGISEVRYLHSYNSKAVLDFLAEAQVRMVHVNG